MIGLLFRMVFGVFRMGTTFLGLVWGFGGLIDAYIKAMAGDWVGVAMAIFIPFYGTYETTMMLYHWLVG